jgi:hypothetical protein
MKSFIKSHRLSLSFDRVGDSDQDPSYELFPESLSSGGYPHQNHVCNNQPSTNRRFSEYYVRSKHNSDIFPNSPSSYSLKKFNPISYIRKRRSEECTRSSYIPSVKEYKEAGAIFGTRIHNWDSRTSTSNNTVSSIDAKSACRHLEQPSGPNPEATTDFSSKYSLHLAPTNFPSESNLSDTKISSDRISTNHSTIKKTVIQAQKFHDIGLDIKNQKVKSNTSQKFDDPVPEIDLFLRQSLVLNSNDNLDSLFEKSSIASPKTSNITPALMLEKRSISNGSSIDTFITANSPSSATNDSFSFRNFDEAIDNEDAHSEFSFEEDKTTGRTSSFKFYSNSPRALQVYPGPSATRPRGPMSYVSKFPSVKFNSAEEEFQNSSQFCTNDSRWDPNQTLDSPVAPLRWTSSCDNFAENNNYSRSHSSQYVTKSCSNLHIDSDDSSNYDYDIFLDEVNAADNYPTEFHDASSYCNELNYQDSIISRKSRSSSRYFHCSSKLKDLKRQHSISRKPEYNAASLHAHNKSNKLSKLSQACDISRKFSNSTDNSITGEFGLTELEENIYCSIMQNFATSHSKYG